MEFEIASDGDSRARLANRDVPDVRVIVQAAHGELQLLVQQRADITRRIGTIKQTIVGLCNLFGDDELSEHLREFVNGKAGVRRRGITITQACRKALMDAGCPLTARNVCDRIQQRTDLPGSKNLVGAVTTVLSRLEQYGETRTVLRETGPRAWLWVAGAENESFHAVNSAVDSHLRE